MTTSQRFFYKFMAGLIFWFHVFCGFVLVFFWQFDFLYPYYLIVLLVALIDNSVFDFCFLAQWECYFRKKLNPNLDFKTFFTFYLRRFFGLKLSPKIAHKDILIILWCLFGLNVIYWIYFYART